MQRRCAFFTFFLLLTGSGIAGADNIQLGLRLPPGFEVAEFADSTLANDIFCMTIDPRGRVVVSGRGYIRILADESGDGKADRAIEFAAGPKDGAQGLLWEGDRLFFTGDGGLRCFRDADGDDKADGPSELIRAMKTGGEHDAHAIRRGPDGWLYVLCGNSTGINRRFAQLPTSPIKDPVAGCVLRFTPDLKSSEIVADGFRNPYGMDFNPDGELFAFDSDNERCVSLPWYEPTRFYHVIPGGHHGWRAPQYGQFWRSPPYFCDVTAPAAYLGRGSPTGVVCYRHTQFPDHYRGGMFLLDWTFGRVYYVPLRRAGSSYTGRPEVFLESVGDNGFAPTAVAVHPATGDLYISIGGRGTRGAVYRVRFKQGVAANSRAMPSPVRQSLDWQPSLEEGLPRLAASPDELQRLRALIALRRHHDRFRSTVVIEAVRANWDSSDRYLRRAAADLVSALAEGDRKRLAEQAKTPWAQVTCCLGTWQSDPATAAERACQLLTDCPDAAVRLDGARILQLCLGDVTSRAARDTVWEGYSARRDVPKAGWVKRAASVIRSSFPSGQADLDRELSRLLAVLEDDDPHMLDVVAGRITDRSPPVEDIHWLIVFARLGGPRSAIHTAKVAATLVGLDRKLATDHAYRDRNWPLRIAELHAELARKDPHLNEAFLSNPEFGRPDHALFARAPGFPHARAAEIFLDRAAKAEGDAWNADVVQLLDALPIERALPVLRRLWGKAGLDDTILPFLARHAQPADRAKFLDGLSSPQPALARACLRALDRLPGKGDGTEALALVKALRGLSDAKAEAALRRDIASRLQRLSGRDSLGVDRDAWTQWFVKEYPDLASRLGGTDGVDLSGWQDRLAKLDWPAGDPARGRAVFIRSNCAACHSGAQALGPDLRGVTGRFSRSDLFTAILQPSKDISPRYRTTAVETADGKAYQGMVIYEAVDSLILQTGPAATVRVANAQIVSRRHTQTSLMPAGLLDKLADRDLADLYAYLKSLSQ